MAKNPFNIGIFSGPSYSGFDIGHGNRVSTKAGVIKPVWCDFLDTGERLKDLDLGALVRQAAMLAPTMDTYEVTIDAFAVRMRTLGMAGRNPWAYEDFFNYNKNIDGSYTLPSFLLGRFYAVQNPLKLGTLSESLNFPSLKWLRDEVLEFARHLGWAFNPVVSAYHPISSELSTNMWVIAPSNLPIFEENGDVDLSSFSGIVFRLDSFPNHPIFHHPTKPVVIDSLVNFVFNRYPTTFHSFVDNLDLENIDADLGLGVVFSGLGADGYYDVNWPSYNVLDEVWKLYHVDAESVLSEYIDYILDSIFYLVSTSVSAALATGYLQGTDYPKNSLFSFVMMHLFRTMADVPHNTTSSSIFNSISAADYGNLVLAGWPDDLPDDKPFDVDIPTYYFDSYWKIISDWYINTALFNPDDFYLNHYFVRNPNTGDYLRWNTTNKLFYRYWKNDYFTSAFPNSQLGNAVGIPVNGTIIDFRNANAWQKFRERLQYAGSRFRDVLYAVTGKRTSAAIMDMSEPLGRWKGIVNVDSVLQTSQSTSNSPQASYAGTGLAYKLDGRSVSYTAEEPTVLMVVMNINPVSAAYFDGFPRKFLRSNLYQYDVPNLANIGEQQIYNYELFFGPDNKMMSASYSPIFGWTRRYGDFMFTPDEVHGDFRGDLDYWHNARLFATQPRLNETFLQVRPDDDNLNRQFAVSSPVLDKFYCHVFFSGHIIRHLPKHAYYDL